jgi:hypothetical protein
MCPGEPGRKVVVTPVKSMKKEIAGSYRLALFHGTDI